MTKEELQPHEIDQKLAPKINHPAPGILYVASRSLLQDTLVNVVRNLVAQVFLHLSFNLFFVKGVDFSRINSVSAEKVPMTLVHLPQRSVRPLAIDTEKRCELQPV